MTFYFSLKSVPELAQLSPLARWRAWFACVHKTFLHWQEWLAFISAVAPIIAAFAVFIWLLPLSSKTSGDSVSSPLPFVLAAVGLFLLSVPGVLIYTHIQIEIIRPYLREYLARKSKASNEAAA